MSLDVHPWRKRYGCIGWALGFNTQASTQVGSESKLWVNVEHGKSQIDRNLWKWKDYIIKHNHDSVQLSLLMWFKWEVLSNSHELSELCLALCTIFGPPKLCGDLTVLQCYWGWQRWIQWLHQAPKTRAWSELWIQGFLRPNYTPGTLRTDNIEPKKKKKKILALPEMAFQNLDLCLTVWQTVSVVWPGWRVWPIYLSAVRKGRNMGVLMGLVSGRCGYHPHPKVWEVNWRDRS